MITILICNQAKYPIPIKKIRERVRKTCEENGFNADAEVSLALVNGKEMFDLAKESSHPVLAFPNNEIKEKFFFPPGPKKQLGEIAISYPQAVRQAKQSKKSVDEVICDLVEHATLHLLGIHHD